MKRTFGAFMLLAGLTGCVTIGNDPYRHTRLPDPKTAVLPGTMPPNTVAMTPAPGMMPSAAQPELPGNTPRYSDWQAHPGHAVMPGAPAPTTVARGNVPPSLQPVAVPDMRPVPPPGAGLPLSPGAVPEMPANLLTATTPPDARAPETKTPETKNPELRQTAFATAIGAPSTRTEPKLPEIVNAASKTMNETPRAVASTPKTEPAPAPTPATSGNVPTGNKGGAPLVRLVNTKRITLNFEVADVGSSGLSTVDLWYTQDGKEWKKHQAPTNAKAYVVEVDEEGMYGFTLVARSGIGLGQEPPAAGDQPQVWVIVDLSKPEVKLSDVTPVTKGKEQEVTIKWSAADKNLGRGPVTLSYAETEEGPWQVIAANLESNGQYNWKVPSAIPAKVFVRAEAADLAGNMGRAQTPKPLLMDSSLPKVSIVNVEANGGR